MSDLEFELIAIAFVGAFGLVILIPCVYKCLKEDLPIYSDEIIVIIYLSLQVIVSMIWFICIHFF